MSKPVPQWMISSFTRSATNIGATVSVTEIENVAVNIIRKLQSTSRHYHNVNHLTCMLSKVDELADLTHNSDCVRIAAWFHAVFYNSYLGGIYPEYSYDEPTNFLKNNLLNIGIDPDICTHITKILIDTQNYNIGSDSEIDSQVLFDSCVSIFASTPQEYKSYLSLARQEYSNIPLCIVLSARKKFITQLLNRSKIFVSPIGKNWEISARQNLEAELIRLSTELNNIPDNEKFDLQNLDSETVIPQCKDLKNTILFKRVSVAEKLSKAKVNSVTTSKTNIPSVGSLLSTTHTITKIDDLTSSLEMVEDCLDSNSVVSDKAVEDIEFE